MSFQEKAWKAHGFHAFFYFDIAIQLFPTNQVKGGLLKAPAVNLQKLMISVSNRNFTNLVCLLFSI